LAIPASRTIGNTAIALANLASLDPEIALVANVRFPTKVAEGDCRAFEIAIARESFAGGFRAKSKLRDAKRRSARLAAALGALNTVKAPKAHRAVVQYPRIGLTSRYSRMLSRRNEIDQRLPEDVAAVLGGRL
jgi:hypothetical protein